MTATTRNGGCEATTAPLQPPQPSPAQFVPEWIRLPKPGTLCAYTGMTRSALNELILPSERNGGKPPVRSFCLRQRGARTGIRLIDYASLRAYIWAHEEKSN